LYRPLNGGGIIIIIIIIIKRRRRGGGGGGYTTYSFFSSLFSFPINDVYPNTTELQRRKTFASLSFLKTCFSVSVICLFSLFS